MLRNSFKSPVWSLMAIAVALCFVAGCSRTRILLVTPNAHTDYVIGKTYSLKQPVYRKDGAVFPLGFGATPTDVSLFRERHPELLLMEAKSEFVVTDVQVISAPVLVSC